MHRAVMHACMHVHLQALFDVYLDFPKPLFAAVNGPAIVVLVYIDYVYI